MLKFTRSDRIDFIHYEDLITSTGYIYVDPAKIPSHLEYDAARQESLVKLATREMIADGGFRYGMFDKDTIVDYLVKEQHVPYEKLYNKKSKTGAASLDAKKVLVPLLNSGYATNFLKLYMEQSSVKFIIGRIKGMFSRLENHGEVSREDKPIERLKYTVRQKDNFRYNYKNEDIISIPKSYTRNYTVPKGYFLAWGDLKQSDFRIACNLLIIDETNYMYFEGSDDWYKSMYKILCDFFNRPYVEEEFATRRDIMKVNCLATIYGATKGESEADTVFVQEFAQYLNRCPRYQEFKKRIDKYQELKVPIVIDTYFGNKVSVTGDVHSEEDDNQYYVDDKGAKITADSVLTQALNTPFQSGTSEIVIKTVTAIMDMFYSLGYTEDDVRVYIVRHDEPVFMIHERVMKDMWVLENAKEIYVDSWQPLGLEFSYGYYYSEQDTDLTETIEKSITENIYKVEYQTRDEKFVPYMPLKKIRKFSLGYAYLSTTSVLVILYDSDRNEAIYYTVNSNQKEVDGELVEIAPWNVAAKYFKDNSEAFLEAGVEDLLIDTYFKFPPMILESGLMLVANKNNHAASIANSIAECKAWAHCENNDKIYPGDLTIVSANKSFADGVERVERLQV